jgi:putative hydrolase of the HAD superfamily
MRYSEAPGPGLDSVSVISFDFYDTLAAHPPEGGRGRRLMAYFAAQGWTSREWAYEMLDDVFRPHGRDYDHRATPERHREFCERIVTTLFECMEVEAAAGAARDHAEALWEILGPSSLRLYTDVEPALSQLKSAGYRIVVTSNWQCGLAGFCHALGLGHLVEDVIVSAEVGCEKPDRRIFDEVCRRVGVEPHEIVHVGDTIVADYEGARNAGFHAVVIDRQRTLVGAEMPVVGDLFEFGRMLRTMAGSDDGF